MPEINVDGLVGPTHHYAGLSLGNIASVANRASVANPREAALQGLAKMRFLHRLGVPQAVMPPLERPSIRMLRHLGFTGSDANVLARAARESPGLLSACASASSMWTANAATVSPSADTADGRVHITPANLSSKIHRAIEAPETAAILRHIFAAPDHFVHHPPLAGGDALGDEGAANHTRLHAGGNGPGIHIFNWGRRAIGNTPALPRRFPARQSLEASEAIARSQQLDPATVHFIQQSPHAIDAGVFHNDVIAVGHENLLLVHEHAWVDTHSALERLRADMLRHTGRELAVVHVRESDVAMVDAVSSYLFNSQIVTLPDGSMALIVPAECREMASTSRLLDQLVADPAIPVREVHALDLRQSMRNGGGPACLRLRVSLTPTEQASLPPGLWLDDDRHATLSAWVRRHYRDALTLDDLHDPALLEESRRALDDLTSILGLGPIYPFQGVQP